MFKQEGDVIMYVVGGADENEMLLWHVCLALRDSLNILLKLGSHDFPKPSWAGCCWSSY